MLVGVMEYTLIPDKLLTLHNLGHTVQKPQSLSGKISPMDGVPKGNQTFPRGSAPRKSIITVSQTLCFNCNCSIKMGRIIWFGSISPAYVHNLKRLGRLPFSLCKSSKFLKTKTISFISIKKNTICQKNVQTNLVQVWFASELAPSSVVSCPALPDNA